MKKTKRSRSKSSTKSARRSRNKRASSSAETHHLKSLLALEITLGFLRDIVIDMPISQGPHSKLSTLLRSEKLGDHLGRSRFQTFQEQLDYLENAYMVSGPPMSPITDDIFWYWAMFDVKHKPEGRSLVHELERIMPDTKPELNAYVRPLRESYFGVYVHEGYRLSTQEEVDYYDLSGVRPYFFLRELVTGRRINVVIKEALFFQPGQRLMMRLVELQRPTHISGDGFEPLYASICTPYLLEAKEDEWVEYFNRTLPKDPSRREASYLRLMRSERGLLLWLEYIHSAYHGDTKLQNPDIDLAIYLGSVPDQPENMMHGELAHVNLLKAKR